MRCKSLRNLVNLVSFSCSVWQVKKMANYKLSHSFQDMKMLAVTTTTTTTTPILLDSIARIIEYSVADIKQKSSECLNVGPFFSLFLFFLCSLFFFLLLGSVLHIPAFLSLVVKLHFQIQSYFFFNAPTIQFVLLELPIHFDQITNTVPYDYQQDPI